MVQFKVLTLAKVVTISLSSLLNNCYAQNNNMEDNYIIFSDSITLTEKDFVINLKTDTSLSIQITNKEKIEQLIGLRKPTITIFLEGEKKIALGNDLINSSVPLNCDYFYSIDNIGAIFNVKSGTILFYKVNR